jgi:hypothetical protein
MVTHFYLVVTLLGAQYKLQYSSVCVWVCVCVCVCVRVYIRVYIHTYVHTQFLITLSPSGIMIFSALFSRTVNFFYCFYRYLRTWVFSVWHISVLKKKTTEEFEIPVESHDNTHWHNSGEWSVNYYHFKHLNSNTPTLYVRLTLKGQVPVSHEEINVNLEFLICMFIDRKVKIRH